MAGQPSDPSFQPSGQDSDLTIGRPVWSSQQSYTPPGGSSSGAQQAYAQPAPYTPPNQGYGAQDQAAAYDQTYTSMPPGVAQEYQNYQGYQQQPAYGAQQGQGANQAPPQWQAPPPAASASPGSPLRAPRLKAPGEKGFVGSLFDFSFSSFVTPKIVKVLYVLFTMWTGLIGLTILVIGFRTGGVAGGLFTLVIVEPIFLLLTLGIYRVVLEAFMVIFRIYDEMKKIRENTENKS